MNDNLSPGNIEELKTASKDKVSLTLLKKDFAGKIINGITLIDSLLAKNDFSSTKIYNCKFERCEFSKDNFTSAHLSVLDFSNCFFYSVDFTSCVFSDVKFDGDCKFIDCKFNGVDMTNNVIGLSTDDMKIIGEQQIPKETKVFSDCGFEYQQDGTFKKIIDETKYAVIYHDPEMDPTVWRMSFYYNDECYYTTDFDLDERLTTSYFNEVFNYGKATLIKKISNI